MKRIGFFVLSMVFCSFIFAGSLKHIVMFGDSLSDNGNLYEYMQHQLPSSPPYYEGRFSNGPVWIERLAAAYFKNTNKDNLLDYAYGGAGVSQNPEDDEVLFTFNREIDSYLLSHQGKADEDSLFIVWIGANNYLAIPENREEVIAEVNGGIRQGLEKLIKHGAKHIMVLNLPDLGMTPAAAVLEGEEGLSALSIGHNAALLDNYNDLMSLYPAVQWLYFDVYTTMHHIITYPEIYGFTNTTESCYQSELTKGTPHSTLKMVSKIQGLKKPDACDGFLFFDLVHPTKFTHQILADKAKEVIDGAGFDMGAEY